MEYLDIALHKQIYNDAIIQDLLTVMIYNRYIKNSIFNVDIR